MEHKYLRGSIGLKPTSYSGVQEKVSLRKHENYKDDTKNLSQSLKSKYT